MLLSAGILGSVSIFMYTFLKVYDKLLYGGHMAEYTVLLTYDDDARVWIAENDDIPVVLESGSLDLLMERVRVAVPEILEMNGKEFKDVYLNFTTKRRTKVIA
jgi:hypothetical protein